MSSTLLSTLTLVFLSWTGAAAATPAQIGDPTDHGFDSYHMDHNLVLPQIALGSHYTTRVLLLNMGNAQRMPWATDQALETSGTVYFFHQDGSPFAAGVNGAAPSSPRNTQTSGTDWRMPMSGGSNRKGPGMRAQRAGRPRAIRSAAGSTGWCAARRT